MKENQEEAKCTRQFCGYWLVAVLPTNIDYFFKGCPTELK